MEEEEIWDATGYSNPACCRICVSQTADGCRMHEPINDDTTASLQIILEKLFPSIFNAEQVQHDYSMNWPTKICGDCKGKVKAAFDLYQTCLDSSDRLRKCTVPEPEKHEVPFEVDYVADVPLQEYVECELIPESKSVNPAAARKSSRRTKRMVLRKEESTKQTYIKEEQKPEIEDTEELAYVETHSEDNEPESPICSALDIKSAVSRRPSRKPKLATKVTTVFSRESKKGAKKDGTKSAKSSPSKLGTNAEEVLSRIHVFRCQLCDDPPYSSPMELREHLKLKHQNQIRACDKCPKVFISEQTYQHHQYCHATGRSFFCTLCDKGFQSEHLLKSHVRSHSREAKFLCSYCGKGFSNKSSLEKHVKFHTDSKSWACKLCPCRFNTKECLQVHQRTHSKAKIYKCATCGSEFNKHYSMIKHQIIHTGERPFVCEICPRSFVSPYHVKRHMLTHTGEKPYKCTYCERSFAQSNVLVKHMRMHVGDNPYQCNRCDASFRLLKDLRNHYMEHCQPDENGTCSLPSTDDKDIRFTSTEILKLRFQKDLANHNQMCDENGTE